MDKLSGFIVIGIRNVDELTKYLNERFDTESLSPDSDSMESCKEAGND